MSPQQLVDCDEQSYGCNGGYTTTAYDYIKNAGGLESWNDYRYTATTDRCNFNQNDVVAKVNGWIWTGQGNENSMASWLPNGPISICVDAHSWDDYTGGVMSSRQCGNDIDHCVLIVGYNFQQNPPYWIVRNSWGTDWGVQQGFIYLQYGQNTCSLTTEPTSAQV